MVEKNRVFIGIGSNVGVRLDNLRLAVQYISELTGTSISRISSIYETEPIGVESQNAFLNAVVELRTLSSPFDLLSRLQVIEKDLGRFQGLTWAPRPIDLDILLFEDYNIDHINLKIPHPQLKRRRFVLEPLCEIAGELYIHGTNYTVAEALQQCNDTHWVTLHARAETIIPRTQEVH